MLRQGPCQGIVADEPLLAMLLAAEPAPVTIHSHTPPPAIAAASWQAVDPELPMLLLARGALASQANLLQGPYRRRPNTPATGSSGARWRWWPERCWWWRSPSAACSSIS